jgi:protein-S-isoprenylcysteine O-methyltransferase Ste14
VNPRQIIATYLIVQAACTAIWWAVLLTLPNSVEWFQPKAWPKETIFGFWLGDSLLLIGGSLFVASAVHRKRPWAVISIWSLAAAVWYPTLYCIGVSILTDEAWIAAAMMVCMAGLTLAMATIHGHETQMPATIRATPMPKVSALQWTFLQTSIFWSVFLWIIPQGIVELESRLGLGSFQHAGQSVLATGLFLTASCLGAWSAFEMAMIGSGTPLPTATAPELVVSGPYRFVRNPMALAGITQGLAVGWGMGSGAVIIYAITGAFAWHWFVRPVEEADLLERFNDRYRQYQKSVNLWVPRLRSTKLSKQIEGE